MTDLKPKPANVVRFPDFFRVVALALITIALSALSPSGPAVAGPPYPIKPNFKFDAQSKFGLIDFLVEPQTVVPNFTMEVERFSLEERRWTYTPLKGWSRFGRLGTNRTAPVYAISAVDPPATYALNQIGTQGYWKACFNGGTKMFEVKPGVVTFVGRLDPAPTLRQIVEELPSKVGGHIAPSPVTLYDTPRPALTPPDDMPGWQAELEAHLGSHFPSITAPVEPALLVDTTFGTGKTIIGTTCERY